MVPRSSTTPTTNGFAVSTKWCALLGAFANDAGDIELGNRARRGPLGDAGNAEDRDGGQRECAGTDRHPEVEQVAAEGPGSGPENSATTSTFSAAVSVGTRLKNWKTNLTWIRRWSVSDAPVRVDTSIPETVMLPDDGDSMAPMRFNRMVLPEPLGPSSTTSCPGSSWSETSRRAMDSSGAPHVRRGDLVEFDCPRLRVAGRCGHVVGAAVSSHGRAPADRAMVRNGVSGLTVCASEVSPHRRRARWPPWPP